MRPRIDQLADGLLDAMGGHETVDLIQAYAWPLPLQVMCDLLGIPADSREAFRTWTTIVTAGPTRHHERPA
ncbi:hypothetical protein AB0E08_13695 [Streptomyces sp. NPDC048281]|uniref:hypothetical protein n=1 Tax=Streptomyces sp. NPDC048281 TaxID=3154715 RepID=UPI0034372FD6